MQRDRDDDDDEDHAEYIEAERVSELGHGINGKHNGSDAAQARPADDADLIDLGAKRRQQRRDGGGTGDDRHKDEDEDGGDEHVGADEIFGRREEPQQEKDHHLRDARKGVEKAHAVAFLRDAGVTDHDAADIDGEIAVPRERRDARDLAEKGGSA